MIKDWDGKKYTPKQAAQELIKDALSNGLDSWEDLNGFGQDIAPHITERERELIDDQVHKIYVRLAKYLRRFDKDM
jgi:hypothetical protein